MIKTVSKAESSISKTHSVIAFNILTALFLYHFRFIHNPKDSHLVFDVCMCNTLYLKSSLSIRYHFIDVCLPHKHLRT
jgi:hypothetical protein